MAQLQRLIKTSQLVTVANDYVSVSGSINEGRPLRLHSPGSRVLADIHALAKMQVTPGHQHQFEEPKKAGGFRWLLRAFAAG